MKALASRDATYREDTAAIVRAVLFDLDRAQAKADALGQALNRARTHVNAREIAQAGARAQLGLRDDDRVLDSRHVLGGTLPTILSEFGSVGIDASDLIFLRALERASVNNPALERARDRELALTLARADTGDLRRDLDRAHAWASDLRRDLDHDHTPGDDRARNLANDLDRGRGGGPSPPRGGGNGIWPPTAFLGSCLHDSSPSAAR